MQVLNKINGSPYTVLPLYELLDNLTDGTHHTPTYTETGVKFVSVTNITENEIDFENTKYISEKEHYELVRRCNPEPNNILLTKIGSIGRAAVIPEFCPPFSLFVSVALLKANEKIIPDYLCAYLNSRLSLRQFKRHLKGIGVPDLHLENIAQTQIIVPSIEEQVKFASRYMDSFVKYKKNLDEATEIIKRIPLEFAENIGVETFDKRQDTNYYALTLKQVKSNLTKRLDTKCYSKKYQTIRNEIDNSCYKKYKLKDLILEIMGGDWGEDLDAESSNRIRCLVLRATEISNKYNIEIHEEKAQYRQIDKKKFNSMGIEIGDIIIEKSGGSIDQPVGRVVYIDKLIYNNTPIAYSNFLTKIKVNKTLVDPYYLFEYLRFTHSIGLTEVMQNQTNGIRNLIVDEFLEQTVVVPPNHYEIGCKIKEFRIKAHNIQIQAEQEWQTAKEQFEKELLG